MAVVFVGKAVGDTTQFYIGNVFKIENLAVLADVAELLGSRQAASVAHDVLERLVSLFAECTGSSLYVLLGKGCRYVGRHEMVLCHYLRLEPYTHGIVGAKRHYVADSLDTLQLGNDVDFHVVVQEFRRVARNRCRIDQCNTHKHGRLAFTCLDTYLVYFGWKKVCCCRYTVLHVYCCHVGVKTLLKIYVDGSRARISCGRLHIGHALCTIDRFFQRGNNGVEHRGSIGTTIGGGNGDSRRCYIRILCHRQRGKADDTQKHYKNRDYRRQYRTVDKSV